MLRQMELAKRIGPDPTTRKNMLFDATKKFAPQTLSTKGAFEATLMSVVRWTKSVLGRHLTMKLLGRKPVMTKLVNDPRISLEEAAKLLHVTPKTLSGMMIQHWWPQIS